MKNVTIRASGGHPELLVESVFSPMRVAILFNKHFCLKKSNSGPQDSLPLKVIFIKEISIMSLWNLLDRQRINVIYAQ